MFIELGDVVKALRVLEGRGGSASLELFLRLWGPYAYAVLNRALDWDLVYRGGDVYKLARRGRELLKLLGEGCPVEARVARGRLWLKTPVGLYAVELTPSYLLSLAYKLAEACGEEPWRIYAETCRTLARAASRSLDKWLLRRAGALCF